MPAPSSLTPTKSLHSPAAAAADFVVIGVARSRRAACYLRSRTCPLSRRQTVPCYPGFSTSRTAAARGGGARARGDARRRSPAGGKMFAVNGDAGSPFDCTGAGRGTCAGAGGAATAAAAPGEAAPGKRCVAHGGRAQPAGAWTMRGTRRRVHEAHARRLQVAAETRDHAAPCRALAASSARSPTPTSRWSRRRTAPRREPRGRARRRVTCRGRAARPSAYCAGGWSAFCVLNGGWRKQAPARGTRGLFLSAGASGCTPRGVETRERDTRVADRIRLASRERVRGRRRRSARRNRTVGSTAGACTTSTARAPRLDGSLPRAAAPGT